MIEVKEEFELSEVADYLSEYTTLMFIGPTVDERTNAVCDCFASKVNTVKLTYSYTDKMIGIDVLNPRGIPSKKCNESEFAEYLSSLRTENISYKQVMMDISSLQGPCLMMLLVVLFRCDACRPGKLFSAYVKPKRYKIDKDRYTFSENYREAAAIPGLVARVRDGEVLFPFLGFEGARLTNIVGDTRYKYIHPIIGFPSAEPKWQFETMLHCMGAIKEQGAQCNISKCDSSSIFLAYDLLKDLTKQPDENYVLAPIGTKPHMVASTIFTIKNSNRCRLIYDYAEQKDNQSEGIQSIKISHLSSYL